MTPFKLNFLKDIYYRGVILIIRKNKAFKRLDMSNGMNYLSWYDKLSNVQIEMIFKGLLTLKDSLFQNAIYKTRLFHNAANYLVWARKMIGKSPNILKNVIIF
mgnify:CR=1 FL=1